MSALAEKDYLEIIDSLMLIDTWRENISIQQINNRRFMFSPQSGELILGKQYKGTALYESHAEEHGKSGAKAPFDSFVRGWVGTGKHYPQGIIHFAPAIDCENQVLYSLAFTTLEMFRQNGGMANTVIRGFGAHWEQPFSDIIPFASTSK